jgi:vanillate O-demethylase ferredoxin subunit
VQLAPGLARSYSLANDPAIRGSYEIGVHLSPTSRGGSRHIHERWRAGDVVEISNRKQLPDGGRRLPHGADRGRDRITPMLPMIARLNRLGCSWELHYVAASPERAAYVAHVEAHDGVVVAFDGIPAAGGSISRPSATPRPPRASLLLRPFRHARRLCGDQQRAPEGPHPYRIFQRRDEVATEGGYTLELVRSGQTIAVEEGETMLDALLGWGRYRLCLRRGGLRHLRGQGAGRHSRPPRPFPDR